MTPKKPPPQIVGCPDCISPYHYPACGPKHAKVWRDAVNAKKRTPAQPAPTRERRGG